MLAAATASSALRPNKPDFQKLSTLDHHQLESPSHEIQTRFFHGMDLRFYDIAIDEWLPAIHPTQ